VVSINGNFASVHARGWERLTTVKVWGRQEAPPRRETWGGDREGGLGGLHSKQGVRSGLVGGKGRGKRKTGKIIISTCDWVRETSDKTVGEKSPRVNLTDRTGKAKDREGKVKKREKKTHLCQVRGVVKNSLCGRSITRIREGRDDAIKTASQLDRRTEGREAGGDAVENGSLTRRRSL